MKQAFHNASFKLSTEQVKEMLINIKTNLNGDYNYHILLCELFGDDYQLEFTELPKLPTEPMASLGDEK